VRGVENEQMEMYKVSPGCKTIASSPKVDLSRILSSKKLSSRRASTETSRHLRSSLYISHTFFPVITLTKVAYPLLSMCRNVTVLAVPANLQWRN
jgi:hypothetical protein